MIQTEDLAEKLSRAFKGDIERLDDDYGVTGGWCLSAQVVMDLVHRLYIPSQI